MKINYLDGITVDILSFLFAWSTLGPIRFRLIVALVILTVLIMIVRSVV